MAKAQAKAAGKRTVSKPRKWPQSADLKPWLECFLDLREQYPQPDTWGHLACNPLIQLAECGATADALTRLQRLLDRLPAAECRVRGLLAMTGAEICLSVPELRRAKKYLELAEACQTKAKGKEQKYITRWLTNLKREYGLPLPEDAATEDSESDAAKFQIGQCRAKYRAALGAGDTNAAAQALQKIAKLIPELDFTDRPAPMISVINGFRRLKDQAALVKYVDWIDRSGESSHLDTGSLWGMGLTELATRRTEKRILLLLKELKTDPDPNIHFPVKDICDELWFMVQTGQKDVAAKLLEKVLRELPRWKGLRGGAFPTAGALSHLAEVRAEVAGPESAVELLRCAVQIGQAEKHRGFRENVVNAAQDQIEAPTLDAAIAQIQTIRQTRLRRSKLIELLVKRAAWERLATYLDGISKPKELHDAVHSVLYDISGGARL